MSLLDGQGDREGYKILIKESIGELGRERKRETNRIEIEKSAVLLETLRAISMVMRITCNGWLLLAVSYFTVVK